MQLLASEAPDDLHLLYRIANFALIGLILFAVVSPQPAQSMPHSLQIKGNYNIIYYIGLVKGYREVF